MLMEWKDLLPGDKIKLSKETIRNRNSESWFDDFKNLTLVIKSVTFLCEGEIHIEVSPRGGFDISYDGDSVNYFGIPLFEVVELCEDN